MDGIIQAPPALWLSAGLSQGQAVPADRWVGAREQRGGGGQFPSSPLCPLSCNPPTPTPAPQFSGNFSPFFHFRPRGDNGFRLLLIPQGVSSSLVVRSSFSSVYTSVNSPFLKRSSLRPWSMPSVSCWISDKTELEFPCRRGMQNPPRGALLTNRVTSRPARFGLPPRQSPTKRAACPLGSTPGRGGLRAIMLPSLKT